MSNDPVSRAEFDAALAEIAIVSASGITVTAEDIETIAWLIGHNHPLSASLREVLGPKGLKIEGDE